MKISRAQKQKNLELILHHSHEAFTQDDYENVKLSSISKACGIAEGTLYNYFKDKPTLFIATFIKYRSDNNQLFKVYKPNDFDSLIDEIIDILSYYMKIDHPKLEHSFKRFLHLLREQKLMSYTQMEQALVVADQYIYDAILELLRQIDLDENDYNLLFKVIVKQVEGIFNDYLYGDISFEIFLSTVREHITLIINPYVLRAEPTSHTVLSDL